LQRIRIPAIPSQTGRRLTGGARYQLISLSRFFYPYPADLIQTVCEHFGESFRHMLHDKNGGGHILWQPEKEIPSSSSTGNNVCMRVSVQDHLHALALYNNFSVTLICRNSGAYG
jgi:hypothetical protein